jgi:hypothetical protein
VGGGCASAKNTKIDELIYSTSWLAKSINSLLNFLNIHRKLVQKNLDDLWQTPTLNRIWKSMGG